MQPFPEAIERVIGRAGRPLGWMWDRGFRLLFVLDAVAGSRSMVLINLVRFGWTWPTYPRSHYWIGFALATLVHLTVNYFAGLYERTAARLPAVAPVHRRRHRHRGRVDGLAAVLTDRYLMPRINLGVLLIVGSVRGDRQPHGQPVLREPPPGPSRLLLVGHGEAVELAERHFAVADRARLWSAPSSARPSCSTGSTRPTRPTSCCSTSPRSRRRSPNR